MYLSLSNSADGLHFAKPPECYRDAIYGVRLDSPMRDVG